jgi:hypothetical protein
LNFIEQALQGLVAALHIANQVHCHGMIVIDSPTARLGR